MTATALQQGYYWLLRHLNSPLRVFEDTRENFDANLIRSNPFLGTLETGLAWKIETYLSCLELEARGFVDTNMQRRLDTEYKIWKKKNS